MNSTKTAFAQNLQEVEVLLETEGPIISHYRDQSTQQDYLMMWYDINWTSRHENENFYLTFMVTKEDVEEYKSNQVTMLELLKRSRAIYECVDRAYPETRSSHGVGYDFFVDPDGVARGELVLFRNIPEDHLPTDESYLHPREEDAAPSN